MTNDSMEMDTRVGLFGHTGMTVIGQIFNNKCRFATEHIERKTR